MKKICSKCGSLLEDATTEDRICPQCGGTLNVLPEDARRNPAQQRQMNVDNRIHKGDNIGSVHNGNETHVSGDNAENIDKRTSYTTNNTTNNTSNVTNIIQAKDEGMELVRCEISGRNVRRIDTFQCKVCHRTVCQDFFDSDYKCCEECAKKQRQAAQNADYSRRLDEQRQRQAAEQQRQEQQRRQNIQSNTAVPPRITTPSASTSQPYHGTACRETAKKESSHKFLWTVIFLLLAGGGYYMWAGQGDEQMEKTEVEEPEAPAVAAASEAPAAASTDVKVEKRTESSAPVAAAPSAAEAPAKAEPQRSPFEEGEKAYKNGEYSKAKVFLQQAADGGKAMANYYLAQMYENGQGVTPDLRKAFGYMKKAAEGGCAKAYFPLAEMLRNGDGTEANRAQAKKWYERTVTSDRAHADMAAEILETYE